MTVAWLALLVAAEVGVHLTEAAELPKAEAMVVVHELADALTARTGREMVVDDPLWSGCEVPDPCLDEIRSRTRTEELILVRVTAGVTLLRVEALRVGGAPVEVDITRADRAAGIERLAAALFVKEKPALLPTPEPPVSPPPPSVSPFPLVVGGVAVVALAVGVGFGVSSRSARQDSQDPTLARSDFELLADRTQSHAIVADISFVVAAIAGVGAGVLWLSD